MHSPQCDPKAAHGDFKIYGRATEIPDDGTDPTRPRPARLFAMEIDSAAFISFGEQGIALRWDVRRGSNASPTPSNTEPSRRPELGRHPREGSVSV